MKRKIKILKNGKTTINEVNYIPLRFIFAILISVLEIAAIITVVVLCTYFIPFFFIAVILTKIFCAVLIANSQDNPDYKVPWLLVVLLLPIVGFMCYFMFYSRKLTKKQRKKMKQIKEIKTGKDDSIELMALKEQDSIAYAHALCMKKLANTNLYNNTEIQYFSSGEEMHESLLNDLKKAQKFIFMEYFIIEEGLFWDSILNVLKEKAKCGVEVRVVYDDIGCMKTLPGDYYKRLSKFNIHAVPFNRLKGQANNEFNNRNHRKITVIDGKIAYTGGINIADEYINRTLKFGHWKDTGIRLDGAAANELTSLLLCDYEMSVKTQTNHFKNYFTDYKKEDEGFCIPFGDGPKPMYNRRVAKTVLLSMLNQAQKYVYITTPYLIIDNELVKSIEYAALRGVDVRIITPHIPDKKSVFMITRSFYKRLLRMGVTIAEYTPGFIHAKSYLCDDLYAMVGTVNLDYRSLVHHFENGVWLFKHKVLSDMKKDFLATFEKSVLMNEGMLKDNLLQKVMRQAIQIIAPLL